MFQKKTHGPEMRIGKRKHFTGTSIDAAGRESSSRRGFQLDAGQAGRLLNTVDLSGV
ncbi:hypothetical protein [Burkholderia lata]|uniref:hypothetical protein n=1 Tax=Burkholderia lata (strain ATCC 17760 / DSM 23089 / LMG 22485 / NCIMB 9086 / R18194 / 383) TaxID=482957 RepID=UPI001581A598|nr:hypothetical protein [Burkholderia lata]